LLVQDLGVVAGVFLAREGVQDAADRIDLLGDLRGGAALGALEEQVLEEVRDARLMRLLVAAAVLHPDPHRDRREIGQPLGEDADPVRQTGRLHVPTGVPPAGPRPSSLPFSTAGPCPAWTP